jgi:hypothetical protein
VTGRSEARVNFIGGTADEWWKLSSRLEKALRDASNRLDVDGKRSLKLGSAVLIGTANGDVMRVPVILQGGSRELPVAYIRIENPRVDSGRIDTMIRHIEGRARAMLVATQAATGEATEIVYP